jgi:(1->4)-alpha-D-glucan 1-alpha-D-glucosylmutase
MPSSELTTRRHDKAASAATRQASVDINDPASEAPTHATELDRFPPMPSQNGEEARQRIVDLVLEEIARRKVAPRATYRLQFHNGFGFREAADAVTYLRKLGISHVYASPVWRARPGSEHGYDACSQQEFDPELGGQEGWDLFQSAVREQGMRVILDIVPNHMSTHWSNLWWNDVLENGPSSPFAKYFDVDWHPVKQELNGRVLLPVLGRQYGDALEAGDIRVEFQHGALTVRLGERTLPVDPKAAPLVLARRLDELRIALVDDAEALAEYESILTALDHLPSRNATTIEAIVERQRDKEVVKRRLRDLAARSEVIRSFIDGNVAQINGTPGDPASFDELDGVLGAQVFRLCHWKAAGDEVNYRRFFDINELTALCVEDADVFYDTHRLIMRLVGETVVAGLRVDHIDGLFAPEQYLWRLQWGYLAELVARALKETAPVSEPKNVAAQAEAATISPADGIHAHEGIKGDLSPDAAHDNELAPRIIVALCHRLGLPRPGSDDWRAILGRDVDATLAGEDAENAAQSVSAVAAGMDNVPLFVVVEKILGPHEPLPESWPVAGTTGYDFLQMCDGLFLPEEGWRQLKRDYARLVDQPSTFAEVAYDSKSLILRVAMSGELQMLAHHLNRISEQHRRSRDFTLNMLRYALREILVCFPVYRMYPGPAGVSQRDRHFVAQAVALAKRRNPATDPSVFDFVRDVLLLVHPPGLSEAAIHQRELFAGRFQQVTSPVMAKGVEDTTFYVYCPLLSVNEVGNGPEAPSVAPAAFHAWNKERARTFPQAMLASSTHDTKRSEDVRARLHLLAELPRPWRSAVQRWVRLNRRRRVEVDGLTAPSRNDEYLFYQSLLGIFPLEKDVPAAGPTLTERMGQYMDKAVHEAKQRTSWINPNDAYDRAVQDFVKTLLDDRRENRFLADVRKWQAPLATLGLVNGLAELVLKLTCPGFPDIYQGQETWALRLVDPDNRQPVDFRAHEQLLAEIARAAAGDGESCQALIRALATNLADPRTKLYVTWRLLELRRRLDPFFSNASYLPLTTSGAKAEHAVAFARVAEGSDAAAQPAVLVVVPRLVARLMEVNLEGPGTNLLPCGDQVWADTQIELPGEICGNFVNVLTGGQHVLNSRARVAELLGQFPVAVLAKR